MIKYEVLSDWPVLEYEKGGIKLATFREPKIKKLRVIAPANTIQQATKTGSQKLPSFKESAVALSKKYPAGLTDGDGNLSGLAYYGAKAMYDFIVETCQLRAGV
jgi:hypothetical protein